MVAKHAEIIREVIPLYREMQATGQIEVMTTPFYHPIMPLIYDTDLARIASPKLDLPAERSARPEDVEAQLGLAVDSYQSHFGARPRGLWPPEQAVGQKIVDLVHNAGFDWMVSSEGVLARSLGVALRDGAGNVVKPELLYRPYIVEEDGKQVTILFRDIVLSDKIGFSYSGMTGRAAARDLVSYLKKVKADLAGVAGPHIVTIALDGENCWEYYANDGKEFLHAMYEALNPIRPGSDGRNHNNEPRHGLFSAPPGPGFPQSRNGSAGGKSSLGLPYRARRALEEVAGGSDACDAVCGSACGTACGAA